ncbi:MAG TPA: hypothetical protein PKI20_15195 [Verrucomicrobiota bacterium]|jgi:DNA/RNA endonuclease YhcR with UshA esterase domain|nr:hypothetical protein [Verrucomicrobiota bacterium]HQL79066.1 hypothetical protein [Verrucomicrobiota bacterium]
MKSLAILFLALCLTAASRSLADTTNAPALTIGAAQAGEYIGKQATVTGVVAQVSVRPGITFLNFDRKYPSNTFAAIVRNRNTNGFENLPALKGKAVAVSGKVVDYNGKAEMELTRKSQLKLLNDAQ